MKLGYVTNGLRDHRLDDALRLLADHGYEAVAITPDVGHLDPYRTTAAEIEAIGTLCAALKLTVVVETGARFLLDPRHKHEPTLMSAEAAARAARVEFYARCAAIARDLGALVLSFWSGVDRTGSADSAAILVEGVERTCEAVRARGISPSIEPEPGMALANLADYEKLAQCMQSRAPSLTLDVGHLYVDTAASPNAIREIAAQCQRMAARCAQVQIEDMRFGVHEHLPPGEGDVDFVGALTALTRGGYGGPVCFELSRSSHRAPELVAACARLFRAAAALRGTGPKAYPSASLPIEPRPQEGLP
ncbi:MAG: sugar phosphate isomerase/epimerase family protein [Planctomycetota bacterium]